MASILSVEQLRGLSSGDNPNTITLPTGQTLDFSAGTLSMPAGHVIQAVNKRQIERSETTSSSYTASGIFIEITPKSTDSVILLSFSFQTKYNNQTDVQDITLYRSIDGGSAQNLETSTRGTVLFVIPKSGSLPSYYREQLDYVDAPSTTSLCRYEIYHSSPNGGTVRVGEYTHSPNIITAMEIAG